MKIVLAIVAAGAGIVVAPGAFARDAGPQGAAVAECVVDNASSSVRALLDTVPGSAAEKDVAPRVLDYYGGCNDNTGAAGTIAWRERAEIANAALRKRLRGKSPDAVAAASNAGWSLNLISSVNAGSDYDPNSVGMRQLGDCIVRAAPGAALDLARSSAGSSQEAAAINALAPSIGPCVPSGQNFRVKRPDLRLIVAEPLYHMLSR